MHARAFRAHRRRAAGGKRDIRPDPYRTRGGLGPRRERQTRPGQARPHRPHGRRNVHAHARTFRSDTTIAAAPSRQIANLQRTKRQKTGAISSLDARHYNEPQRTKRSQGDMTSSEWLVLFAFLAVK